MAWTKAKAAMTVGASLLLTAATAAVIVKEVQPARDSAQVEMKMNWPIGRKYGMRMDLNQITTTEIPGLPAPITQEVKLVQDFDISALKEIPGGGHQLELQFKSQTIDVSQGVLKIIAFDSAQPAAQDASSPFAPLLRKMIGGRVRYLVAADGKVEKVEGVEDLMTRIGFNRKSQDHAAIMQLFSEETLKQYGSLGEDMPNRTVKVGETWRMKIAVVTEVGKLVLDMKYTFKNWEQRGEYRCAHIDAAGRISPAPAAGAPGTTVKLDSGKISGEIWFDPELGMIVDERMDEDMALRMVAGAQTLEPRTSRKIRLTLMDAGKAP